MADRGQAFRVALDRAIAAGQLQHLAPVLTAVREADIGCIQLRPADPLAWVLNMGSGNGWVCLVGDDRETSSGPGGFDAPSLVQVLERASAVAVYSGAADAKFYTTFAVAAVLGGRVVVIETQLAQHVAWLAFVRAHAPDANLLDICPPGGTA